MPLSDRKITVALVDGETLVRAGMRALLDGSPHCRVVIASPDIDSALVELARVRPDLVILEVRNGRIELEAIEQLKRATPRSRVAVASRHGSREFAMQALQAGADGYVSMDSEPEELIEGVQAIHRGGTFVTPSVAPARRRPTIDGDERRGSGLAALTARELEVFQWIASGRSNKDIAQQLKISLGTVKKHRENLQRKLDLHSAAELARLAIREGLLVP